MANRIIHESRPDFHDMLKELFGPVQANPRQIDVRMEEVQDLAYDAERYPHFIDLPKAD